MPNLGVVALSGERAFVVADIPGLIEGAAGRRARHRFLRHVERTRVLLHILDATRARAGRRCATTTRSTAELERYDPALAARPQLVAMSKLDLPEVRKAYDEIAGPFARRGIKLPAISAATGEGTAELLESIWRALPPRSGST